MKIKRMIAQGIEAALELGDLDAADTMLEIVRQARPGMVTPSLRAQAARFEARLSALRGDHESVVAGFVAAVAGFREIEVPFELGVTLIELAEWLSGQSRVEEARRFGLESRSLFEQLEARPWLARVPIHTHVIIEAESSEGDVYWSRDTPNRSMRRLFLVGIAAATPVSCGSATAALELTTNPQEFYLGM